MFIEQKKLQQSLIEKEEMTQYVKGVEEELTKETEKNSEWSKLWEEKMKQINKMENQIKAKVSEFTMTFLAV